LVGYYVRTSVLGGRFVLVDTLRADVQVVVAPGADSSDWRYTYSVIHRPNSTGRIDYVAIGPLSSRPLKILSPPHWEAQPIDDAERVTLVWSAELGAPPPGWVDDGANIYPSEYALSPGDSVGGFGFTARGGFDPFANVAIDLRVWQPIPSMDEEWIPECTYRAVGSILGPGRRP
jgi:hypothetical protein